jgi:hypothetical protein
MVLSIPHLSKGSVLQRYPSLKFMPLDTNKNVVNGTKIHVDMIFFNYYIFNMQVIYTNEHLLGVLLGADMHVY